MNVEECFQKKLLKKIPSDRLKADASLRVAEHQLVHAHELFAEEFVNDALIHVYMSMFHAARSLLYQDGVQEKSHYAIYIYLFERYSDKFSPEIIESFQVYQKERHNILYGLNGNVSKEEVEQSFEDAESFLQEVRRTHG